MTVTEYGDLMVFTSLDEWGRRRIDGLLEDGTFVIVVVVVPPTEGGIMTPKTKYWGEI